MIYNLTRKSVVARRPRQATGFWERGRGMIGRSFESFDAMIFEDCRAIHTFFMGAPIDAVFVDAGNKVLLAAKELKPWTPMLNCPGARAVIELPPGSIAQSKTEKGDLLDLRAEASPESLALPGKSEGKFIAPPEPGAIAPLEETK